MVTDKTLFFILSTMTITDVNIDQSYALQAEEYMSAVWRYEDRVTKESKPYNPDMCIAIEAAYDEFVKKGSPKNIKLDHYGQYICIDFNTLV